MAVRRERRAGGTATDAASLDALVGRLQARQPDPLVLEATGGREGPVVVALAAVGRPVAVVNPRQVRPLRGRWAHGPRRMCSTPQCWPSALSSFTRGRGRCPTPTPRSGVRCWLGVGSSGACCPL